MSSIISRREIMATSASLLAAAMCAGTSMAFAQQTDETVIGSITRIQSNAVAMQNAFPRILEQGSEIMLGDVISTSKDARVEFTTLDGGVVTLGESTLFVVMEFVMSEAGGNIIMQLMEGAFLATSGTMNKLAENSFKVETPFATIGIRGTTVWGGTLSETFEVALIDGKGVTVETYAGRVELDEVGQGTKILDRSTSPSNPKVWGTGKIDQAKATVTFN